MTFTRILLPLTDIGLAALSQSYDIIPLDDELIAIPIGQKDQP
jgi:hypothetical protein